jgi:hypothetical protein
MTYGTTIERKSVRLGERVIDIIEMTHISTKEYVKIMMK